MTLALCLLAACALFLAFIVPACRRDKARPTFRGTDGTWFRHRDYIADARRQLDYGLKEGHIHPVPTIDTPNLRLRLFDAGIETESMGPAAQDAGMRIIVRRRGT
jgi:hypothetical protein